MKIITTMRTWFLIQHCLLPVPHHHSPLSLVSFLCLTIIPLSPLSPTGGGLCSTPWPGTIPWGWRSSKRVLLLHLVHAPPLPTHPPQHWGHKSGPLCFPRQVSSLLQGGARFHLLSHSCFIHVSLMFLSCFLLLLLWVSYPISYILSYLFLGILVRTSSSCTDCMLVLFNSNVCIYNI